MPHLSTLSKLDILLKNLGFTGNPFTSLEAGKEEGQDWFYESFVEPPHFDEIIGDARSPQPMLIFAPRGSGKTALRVMVHYYCQRGYVPGGPVLSILLTDLSRIQEMALRNLQIDLARHYVQAILRAGVTALAQQAGVDSPLRERLAGLQREERTYLRWFVSQFDDDLSPVQRRHLREVRLTEEEGMGFLSLRQLAETSTLRDLLEKDSLHSYVELLRRFVDLMHDLGFRAIYVLVDGVDELAWTAAEVGHAAWLVEPLAANLKILDMPGVAFRLFLPAEMRLHLEALGSVRQDRIVWYSLEWEPDRLLDLLHKRLQVFSNKKYSSLDQICSDDLARGRLEREMVEACAGSPRKLLRLGRELFSEQAILIDPDSETDWRLREEAWQRARDIVLGLAEAPQISPQQPILTSEAGDPEALVWQRVLSLYPSPIALVCRDYRSRRELASRLTRLLDAFEATIGFCAVLMIAQYQQQVQTAQAQGRQARSLVSTVGHSCEQMSLGRWLWVLDRLTGLSGSLGRTDLGRRLHRLLAGESNAAIQRLRDLRNTVAHQAQSPTFYEEHLPAAHADLLTILSNLDFLAESILFQPFALKRLEEKYVHSVRLYQGDNPHFLDQERVLTIALKCDMLWFDSNNQLLTLHPLLIASQCPQCRYEEVFLYQRLDDENLVYHNFASGHSLVTARFRAAFHDLLGL